jgi:hypothetical protein
MIACSVVNTVRTHYNIYRQLSKCTSVSVYKLKCLSCDQVYIGQSGRDFSTRYKERMRNIRYNQDEEKYAQHILDQNHDYGSRESTMGVLKVSH